MAQTMKFIIGINATRTTKVVVSFVFHDHTAQYWHLFYLLLLLWVVKVLVKV